MTINHRDMPSLCMDGKTALVTGGSKGIGAATALALAQLGASVHIVARDGEVVNTRVRQWRARGLDVSGHVADLAKHEEQQQLFQALNITRLDTLVNNIGTNIRRKATEYSPEDYDAIVRTNLDSAWQVTMLAYPFLKTGRDAAIVNVASVAGLTHLGTGAPYGMSKAAMIQMTRNLAVEWAVDAIRVNAVAPWYTDTPLARGVLDDPHYRAAVVRRTPLGRVASAHEVAAAITFLCSPLASYVTGECLAVDGGFSAAGFDAMRSDT